MSVAYRDIQACRALWSKRPTAAPEGWTGAGWPRIDRVPEHMDAREAGLPALYETGEVFWAATLGGATALFSVGTRAGPASFLWSTDNEVDYGPTPLIRMAHWMGENRGRVCEVPGLGALNGQLNLTRGDRWRRRLPDTLTGGRICWLSAALVVPQDLPGSYLNFGLLPLLAQPSGEDTQVVTPLPEAFWPPELRMAWLAARPAPPPAHMPERHRADGRDMEKYR